LVEQFGGWLKSEAEMGIRGCTLRVGDDALTDYNGAGTTTRVTIIEADYTRRHGHSQSGIQFRVRGRLKNCTERDWIDSEWFEPAPREPQTGELWCDADTMPPNASMSRDQRR
jgi:hypothetical protein